MTTATRDRMVSASLGDFAWCVNHIDLGDADLNPIVRGVCRTVVVWPEQLLGFHFAADRGGAVRGIHPLSTGPCPDRSMSGHVAFARHWIWYLAHHDTDLHPTTVADLMAFSAGTVWRWTSRQTWRDAEGDEWYLRHFIPLCGVYRAAVALESRAREPEAAFSTRRAEA